MSHKILHFTRGNGEPIAVRAEYIRSVAPYRNPLSDVRAWISFIGGEDDNFETVLEPYDQVLRMWADALSEQS